MNWKQIDRLVATRSLDELIAMQSAIMADVRPNGIFLYDAGQRRRLDGICRAIQYKTDRVPDRHPSELDW